MHVSAYVCIGVLTKNISIIKPSGLNIRNST